MCMFDVVCFSVVTKPIARVNDSRLEGVNTLTRFLTWSSMMFVWGGRLLMSYIVLS